MRVPGFPYAPFDCSRSRRDPAQRAVLLEEGVFGWWMAPDFRMSFWRPLSCLTHVLDHLLWPRSSLLAHAHSMLWFAALLAVWQPSTVASTFPGSRTSALLLYAVDDAHGVVVGWMANRNALVAATLAFAALLAHDRSRRDGWRPGAWLAPALFAAALLGGEAALAVTAYLLAHALFIDHGSLARRLARLWPYATLAVAWLAAYKALGYGTSGGGMYVDPAGRAGAYLGALVERLPVLLAAQLGILPSDVWITCRRPQRSSSYGLALSTVAASLSSSVRSAPAACLPLLGAGSCALAAARVRHDSHESTAGVRRRGRNGGDRSRPRRVAGGGCAGAPPTRSACRHHRGLAAGPSAPRAGAGVAAGWGADPELSGSDERPARGFDPFRRGRPWKDADHPQLPRGAHQPLRVDAAPGARCAEPCPHRLLTACLGELRVSRQDVTTLRVRPKKGFFDNELVRIGRGPSRPFRPGDEIALSGLRARVQEVTPDGRPAEVDFTFAVPLEDSSLLWTRIQAGGRLVPWPPPAVGESQMLPSVAPLRPPRQDPQGRR